MIDKEKALKECKPSPR